MIDLILSFWPHFPCFSLSLGALYLCFLKQHLYHRPALTLHLLSLQPGMLFLLKAVHAFQVSIQILTSQRGFPGPPLTLPFSLFLPFLCFITCFNFTFSYQILDYIFICLFVYYLSPPPPPPPPGSLPECKQDPWEQDFYVFCSLGTEPRIVPGTQ